MYHDDYTVWARFLNWSRHRFYNLHVFLEAVPLSLLWYIRSGVFALMASFILTGFLWSFGLDGFGAEALIASMALFVALLAFIVNYASSIRPSTLLTVRHSSLFANSFGFARDDPNGAVIDQNPHNDLNQITIFNSSKNDIEIMSVSAEVRNGSISISHQAPAETRTMVPISIPGGKSAILEYDYPYLAWCLACTDEPSRPWLVLTASDGRDHRFPFPALVYEDMLRLREKRPTPIGHPITRAYHRYHIVGSFDDHTKQIASYLGLTVPTYAVRYPVDPALGYSFRVRENGQWGSIYTFPDMQDCIDALTDLRSHRDQSDCHIIFQDKGSEIITLGIGTEEQFTFATMDQAISPHGRLLGGSISDVLDAMPRLNALAGISLKEPRISSTQSLPR